MRTCTVDAEAVNLWLDDHHYLTKANTSFGFAWVFNQSAMDDGYGYNVKINGNPTPYFTVHMFEAALFDFSPHVKEAEERNVKVSDILKEQIKAKVEEKPKPKRKPRTKKQTK